MKFFVVALSLRYCKSNLVRHQIESGMLRYLMGNVAGSTGIPSRIASRSICTHRIGTREIFWKFMHISVGN
jgi:hypothetical protein